VIGFFAWLAGLVTLTYLIGRAIAWWLNRKETTEYDRYRAKVDEDLNRLMQPPAMVGSPLDTPAGEFSELDLEWLAENQIGGAE